MRFILSILARTFPPAFVLFLFADLLLNPNIPQLGSVTAGASKDGRLSLEESRELLAESRKLMTAGKDEQALQPLLKLHAVYPENYLYVRSLAEINHRLGRYKEEAEYWEKFLLHAPLPTEGCPDIGLAYWKQKREAEAVDAFERCLAFEPEVSDSIFFLGHALEMTGKLDRAAALYRKAESTLDCRIGLARVEARQGNLVSARRRILLALERSPGNVDALLVAGIVAWRQGDTELARRYLLKGAASPSGYADFFVVLGRIDQQQGRIAEAARHYDHALELQPDSGEAARLRTALGGRRR